MPNATPQRIYIDTDGDESNLDCQLVSNRYMTLKESHQNFSEIYAALLAAQFSERNVTIRVGVGSTDCAVSYVLSDS